ncbi:Lactose transport system permease protein LacG [Labrenzia sp. THAF82]|uniref:carbohydrate ABC transporter permease n=1 Tax=Labrenzia sp. THAF82 TaxID=2587861 RepID=UPI0012680FFF|nr:carbohydrate ABC transporter permease [Labrenzia sp. THAF82]QFT33532.1 Lactose transport system permease protein LacG [Labrenzia sp. THAF82]
MFPKPIKQASPVSRLVYNLLLPVCVIVWLLPILAVFVTSIRSQADITRGNIMGWPSEIQLIQNYGAVLTESDFVSHFLNTIKITVPSALLAVCIATLAGYALAIHRIRIGATVFLLFLAGNFVPFQILLVPIRNLALETGLYDTATGLVLFHAAFQTGFCTLLARNFIKELPFELIETARLDGVGERQIFLRIVLPLIKPVLAAMMILVFTFVWNDFFWATSLTQSNDTRPITAAIQSLNGQFVSRHHLVSAASLLAALPPVILFFLMQKHFTAGLTLGASKG